MHMQTLVYTDQKWSSPFPPWDGPNTLVILFAAPAFITEQAPIKEIISHYPHSHIVGCSSAGEICGNTISDKSITVAVVQFENSTLESVKVANDQASQSFNSGKQIAQMLDKDDLRCIFVLSEGLHVNGSELVKGLNTIKKKDVVITGGLAGDGKDFKQTWGIYKDGISENAIIAVGFYGSQIKIGHGSRGGWDIFGPERRITRSEHNILYELDGRPALSLYKEYLGELANGLPATGLLYPLAIRKDMQDSKHLVRTILAVDEETQSLTFAGDVPTGYLAQLMRANFDRLITAADEAGELATKSFSLSNGQASPILAIAISCVGRRLLLGERTEEEIESTLQAMPKGTQQIGFYSYGELSPYTSGDCDLHNQTMTLTTICEEC